MSRAQRLRAARRWVAVALWATVIFMLSDRSRVPSAPGLSSQVTAVAGHLIAYGILGFLLASALRDSGAAPRRAARMALLLAVLYGVSDEWHQSFVPGRDPSLGDVFTDAVGAALGVALHAMRTVAAPERARRRPASRSTTHTDKLGPR